MRELAVRYAWSSILNDSTERMIDNLCTTYTPKSFPRDYTRTLVRDFCEYTKVGRDSIDTPFKEVASSVKIILDHLGITTEVQTIPNKVQKSILTPEEQERQIVACSDVLYLIKLVA